MNALGVVLVLIFAIVGGIWWIVVTIHNNHLIATGQAKLLVKIAASGQGKTYHAPRCNRCRSGHYVTVAEAQSKYYAPCSSCGGHPEVIRIST